MPTVTTPSSHSFKVKISRLNIDLPFVDESQACDTAEAIANISKDYESIYLYDISADAAVQFVQILQQRNVKVNGLIHRLDCKPHGGSGSFTINFGSIPLTQTVGDFKHR